MSHFLVRCLSLTLLSLVLSYPASLWAQFGVGWTKNPEIVVIGAANDPRQPLFDEAVSFWNKILEELGSSFRLGNVKRAEGFVSADELIEMSTLVVSPSGKTPRLPLPESLRHIPGDLFIVLSDAEFVSFAGLFTADRRRMVAIRGISTPPLSLPNVARNVIAHEIGHAIGLRHNSDDTSLMCGRPSPCRPNLFRSADPKFFPLTDQERKDLLTIYPPNWTPNR